MRYNNTFKVTDTPQIVLPDYLDIDLIKVYNYDFTTNPKIVSNYNIETKGDFIFITLNNLVDNSFYIVTYIGGFEVLRIGNPPIMFFTYLENSDVNIVPYTQYDFNGNVLKNGYLEKMFDNVYGVLITNIVRSFIQVIGSLTTLTLPSKYVNTVTSMSGTIRLQRGNWQLISIPEAGKVKSIFLDRLEKQEGVPITDIVEVVSAYPGSVNRSLTYKTGFTLETSEHNFDLITNDNGSNEINGFWVKCKEWSHREDDIVFVWSNTSGGE